jgi:GMP synthase-like glutamine amidotransferase
MQVLVLQHIACEPPGVYEDVLRERGAQIHRVELDENDSLPNWRGFDAIIAMGGPMSVNDDDKLPWLREEKALISEAVRAGVPFFGACLGAQLLSVFAGAASSVRNTGSSPTSGFGRMTPYSRMFRTSYSRFNGMATLSPCQQAQCCLPARPPTLIRHFAGVGAPTACNSI